MALFLNFLIVPTGALMPLLVTQYFGKEAIDLAWLESAMGVGIIVGGISLSVWGGFKKKIVTSLMGIIGLGLGIMLVGLAPANLFLLAILGNFIVGGMVSFANGPLGALMQTVVRPDMQGRVMSLLSTGATAISPIGLLIAGPVADQFGLRIWFWAGGILCMLIAIAGSFVPAIMNVENVNGTSSSPTTASQI
jgi:DHA3 family macrolide efflux protein-like MFS transporter